MMFLVFKKSGSTREQCQAEWSSDWHVDLADKISGMRRYVQNYVTSDPVDAAPDGIGEMWFDDAAAMDNAVNSPEMAAGFQDAKQFAEFERTLGLSVGEKPILW